MQVMLHEIKRVPTEYHFSQKDDWVSLMVQNCDEMEAPKDRKIHLDVVLQLKGELIRMHGKLATTIYLNCSRCAEDIEQDIDLSFNFLFAREETENDDKRDVQDTYTDISVEEMTEIIYLNEKKLDLDDILNEFFVTHLPFIPLCKDACKGLCMTCGANLNFEKCEHTK